MTKFIDTDSQHSFSNDNISFQMIVLRHLYSISGLASVELRGGYWQKRAVPVGGTILSTEEYVSDTREKYCNAVNHLHDLLLPYFDKDMTQATELADKDFKKVDEQGTDSDDINNKKFKVSRVLFQQLSLFMKRNGYLATKDITMGD